MKAAKLEKLLANTQQEMESLAASRDEMQSKILAELGAETPNDSAIAKLEKQEADAESKYARLSLRLGLLREQLGNAKAEQVRDDFRVKAVEISKIHDEATAAIAEANKSFAEMQAKFAKAYGLATRYVKERSQLREVARLSGAEWPSDLVDLTMPQAPEIANAFAELQRQARAYVAIAPW